MKLTQEQKDLIVGSLLGDGNMQTFTKGRTWRYRASHEVDHLPYLEYKYKLLQGLCSTGIIPDETKADKRTGKKYKRNYFNTRVESCLKHYANLFYTYDPNTDSFVKDVPKNIAKMLTPRAVAIFYQDDGALKWRGHSNAMRLCTESFSLEGNKRLQAALLDLYGIKTTLGPRKNKGVLVGYRISIPEASAAAFTKLISPYLVDCMKYRVSDGKRGDLSEK